MLRHLAGGQLSPHPRPPEQVVETYQSIARLQAVKCSPFDDANLNRPTRTMDKHCPETYLREELEILKPRAVVVMGQAARDGTSRALQCSLGWRNVARLSFPNGSETWAASVYHPSVRYRSGYRQLIELLGRSPVRAN
jgi:uracil-DNA glycosylase